MANYRPLIERLVSGLPPHDADARAFAYQRARQVLEEQFQGDLSIPGDQLALERAALDDAISSVEADVTHQEALSADATRRNEPTSQDDIAALSESAGLALQTQSVVGSKPVASRTSPTNVPKTREHKWAAVAASSLCLFLTGIGFAAWRTFDDYARVKDTSKLFIGGRETTGVSVPAPVRQTGLADDLAVPASTIVQRAALLVAAPQEPQRLKVYVGTVAWRISHTAPSSEQPASEEIRAAIDVPEAKLKVEVVFNRNLAPRLSASHMVEVHFTPQAGNVLGAVDQIEVPEMRDDDALTGSRLSGTQAKVTDGLFLIGLSRGPTETENLHLIETRSWIDLPVLFSGHIPAKLTFEKGATGKKMWAEALDVWSHKAADTRALATNSNR